MGSLLRSRRSSASSSGLTRLGLDERSRVLIVGLGKTGLSVARTLARHGLRFAVTDSRDRPPALAALREELPDTPVFLGGFQPAAFAAATQLVVSPGVALECPPILEAAARGIPVYGDLDLFACSAEAPVVAITGANGKSTVTTLVGQMAEADGRRAGVGGNLGTPMLDVLHEDIELYVLELSSFQLERSSLLEPVAATVLNISPDHQDRYPDVASYAAAKERIFRGRGAMVLNRDDPLVAAMARPGRPCRWFGIESREVEFGIARIAGTEWLAQGGEPVLSAGEVRLKGRHNLCNALAALALGDCVGLSRDAMVETLRRFPGLDHRMQWVAEIDGVAYVNDSKATNVGACIAALSGLEEMAILIAGGDGKGADFSVLRPVVSEKVRAAVLMGKDAPLLEATLRGVVPTVRVANMTEAVQSARRLARPGDTVLLAPACASLDQYTDYQERGRVFADAVRSMKR